MKNKVIDTKDLSLAGGVMSECGKFRILLTAMSNGTIMPVFSHDSGQFRLENINETGFIPLNSPIASTGYERSILADREVLQMLLDYFATWIQSQ